MYCSDMGAKGRGGGGFAPLLLVFGCVAPRAPIVGGDSGSPAPFCGDGVVASPSGPPGGFASEECDDGPLNGTTDSYCTKQCVLFTRYNTLGPMRSLPTPEPHPVKFAVAIDGIGGEYTALASTAFDDAGVYLTLGKRGGGFFTTWPPQRLAPLIVHSAPTGLGRLWKPAPPEDGGFSSPVWVERPVAGVGGPWLFYATFAADLTPTIHEIPYPFPDGVGGSLLSEDRQMPVLIDQSATTNELLVAVIVVRSDSDIAVFTSRMPAAGRQRGVVVGNTGWEEDVVSEGRTNRVVQFYDDTLAFQTVDVRWPALDDPFAMMGPYQISEYARGSWPFRVAQATSWNVGFLNGYAPTFVGLNPACTHPYPHAVMSSDGQIVIWQFDRSPTSENDLTAYASVAPGSIIQADYYGFSYPAALWVLEPDGTQLLLGDGDDAGCRGPALKPLIAAGTSAWTDATPLLSLLPGGNSQWGYVAVDGTYYWRGQ